MNDIETKRLKIRKFTEEDLDGLFLLLSDKDVMKYIEPPFSRKAATEFLFKYAVAENPLIYAAENKNNEFIGYVIYHKYDENSYEIGWVLRKSVWGKGYAGELTEALIEYAKGKTDNLIIECSPQQLSTKRIAQKHNFVFEKNEEGLDIYKLSLNGDIL